MRWPGPGLAAIVRVAVPGPTVVGLLVTEIHAELLMAVHAQFAPVVTVVLALPPAAAAYPVSGRTP